MSPPAILRLLGLGFLFFASAVVIRRQGDVSALSSTEVSAFKPYTYFAGAAYCDPTATKSWSCGAKCDANSGFVPVASGGDGITIQFWYVGYDPTLNTVVVAHQGTDPSKILPLMTDIESSVLPVQLDQGMFPGTSGLAVHGGFGNAQQLAASDVLAAVTTALSSHSGSSVTIVGHSLGAAIALIDAVYLPLNLPLNTTFKYVGYGLPRVGNAAFASYLDARFPDLTHVNNKEDPAPVLPGRFLGFVQPHGEIHIQDSGEWDSCAGNDNNSSLCSTGDVSNPLSVLGNFFSDHMGPYDGVTMGC